MWKLPGYRQTGVVTGLVFTSGHDKGRIYHHTNQRNFNQSRMSYLSYGAEIITHTSAEDNRDFFMKLTLRSIIQCDAIAEHLSLQSKGLYHTIQALHKDKEWRHHRRV